MSITLAAREMVEKYRALTVEEFYNPGFCIEIPKELITSGNKFNKQDVARNTINPGDLVAVPVSKNSLGIGIVVGYTPSGYRVLTFSTYHAAAQTINNSSNYSSCALIMRGNYKEI